MWTWFPTKSHRRPGHPTLGNRFLLSRLSLVPSRVPGPGSRILKAGADEEGCLLQEGTSSQLLALRPGPRPELALKPELKEGMAVGVDGGLGLGGPLQSPRSSPCRHALPLFTSLLNTVCAYDPVGYGIPYNHLLFSDYREPLVEEAAQVLIVTLDHDSATSANPTVDGTTTGTAMDDVDVRTGEGGRGPGQVAPPLAELGEGYPVGTLW